MSPRKIAVSLAALGIVGWPAAAIRHDEVASLAVTRVDAAELEYALDRGGLHVRGSAGKGPQEHVEQIRALDDAYAMLARRWHH